MTMTRRSENLLMIAARAPIAGETKTRLGRSIGMQEAADLYQAFLIDIAFRLGKSTDAYDVGWTHSPPEADFAEILTRLTGETQEDVWLIPQDGPNWGVRQDNLLRWGARHGYERSILIASDSPHLSLQTIVDAFAALETADVALGRVRDGGYYLIGLRGYADVLQNVAMSTSSAADGVVERATGLGLSVAEIMPTFDIDEVDDIELLMTELTPDGKDSPATWAALRRLGRHENRAMQGPETAK
jgi:glycosyltransferase A (GT-A) superfamily protein (DUF2064 family)